MKNLIKISLTAVVLTTGLYACKDSFLDTPPQASLSNSTLASNQNGVNSTLISAYKGLVGWTGNWNETAWGTAPSNWVFNIASDEFHKGSEPGDGDSQLAYELYQWNPSDGDIRSKWIATYEGVVRSNSAINTANDYLKNNPSDTKFANSIIGQATFLRAYYHFEAYKVWKNAPYYLESDTDFKKANDQPMLPLIIADLEKAIGLLPENKESAGRADKTVATAYLGKAKLYNKDYAGALAAFNTVIASGKYKLSDCFYDNFSIEGDNNAESIFSVQTSVNDGDGDGGNSNFGERLALPHGDSPYGCCGFKTPSFDLAYSFKVDSKGLPISSKGVALTRLTNTSTDVVDPRLDYTIGRTNVPYLDWGIHKDSWVRGQGYMGWYSPKKNAHSKTASTLSGSWSGAQLSALNVELMRYSDVLLMAAECEVEAGSLEKARDYVNQIRKRAGNCAQGSSSPKVAMNAPEITWAKYNVGVYDAAWTNKDVARDAVRLERKLELATEGHRIFDLQRWGILEATISDYSVREAKLIPVLLQAQSPTAKNYAFPIPATEISRASGKLKQNDGY